MLFKQKISEFLNLLTERSEIPDSIDNDAIIKVDTEG